MTPAFRRTKTVHALDSAATVIGVYTFTERKQLLSNIRYSREIYFSAVSATSSMWKILMEYGEIQPITVATRSKARVVLAR
jgi:hypothetical protein